MKRKLVSFDWAIKRLLRSKANFGILEGFLSELLHDEITILELLESESNKHSAQDKLNRVDLKVKDRNGRILIIEVQYEREYDYLQRILHSASKVISEHLDEGSPYGEVVKVISISILYFDLGQGDDYIYWGTNRFYGVHQHDELRLSVQQKQQLTGIDEIYQLFPEYYLIKVNKFNDIARDTLDEWIYFLKNEEIKPNFTAKGLAEAKDKLDILKLPDDERLAYEHHLDDLHYAASMFQSSYGTGKIEGRIEGRKEGLEEGIKKGLEKGKEAGRKEGLEAGKKKGLEKGKEVGRKEGLEKGKEVGRKEGLEAGRIEGALSIARQLQQEGLDEATILRVTGLTAEQLAQLETK